MKKSLLLVAFAWLVTASNFALAAMVYNYTGNNYASIVNNTDESPDIAYDTTMSINGTVTLSAALASDATATVTPDSFSFFDGRQTLTNLNVDTSTFTFTTVGGFITEWDVLLAVNLPGSPGIGDVAQTIHTQNDTSDITDIGSITTVDSILFGSPIVTVDSGEVANAGVWTTEVSAVPVPAAVWLFGSGLMGLIAIGRRRIG